ncbi:MAG: hypothetical protein J6I96_07600 [Oscillospiraceae bacterium]|nr:hypothetical protein [Oscillospiraceae bacterium]
MNKNIRRIASFCAVLACLPVTSAYARTPQYQSETALEISADNVYHISSGADFLVFATLCTLDSYSKGKTFVLDDDIVLSEGTFMPVPSFSGTFDGGGHKISGFTLKQDCSSCGLFRFVEKSGRIKDLNVDARIIPTGTSEKCGGIAGVNRGVITGCTFSGEINGKRIMGGIAGVNEETGMIASCTSEGTVTAEHYSGGITGYNSGFVIRCENKADVNTTPLDIAIGLNTIDVNDLTFEKLTSAESIAAISDIGGIAGFSDGTVTDCTNKGNIGYRHTGYNIGGICGRHSGYVNRCENSGTINGRKDIGGIVGQAEPYTSLIFSDGSLQILRDRLSELTDTVDTAIVHADSNTDNISSTSTDLNRTLDELRTAADHYTDIADGIINDDIETINELSARISDLIDRTEPVAEKLENAADSFTNALGSLSRAADIVREYSGDADSALDILRPSLDDMSSATGSLKDSVSSLTESVSSVKDALGDPDKLKERLKETEDRIDGVRSDLKRISDDADALIAGITANGGHELDRLKSALEKISRGANRISEDLETSGADVDKLRQYAENGELDSPDDYKAVLDSLLTAMTGNGAAELAQGFSELTSYAADMIDSEAARNLYSSVQRVQADMQAGKDRLTLTERTDAEKRADRERLDASIDSIYKAFDYLEDSGKSGESAGSSTEQMIAELSEAWDYLEASDADLTEAIAEVKDALDSGSEGSGSVHEAIALIHDISDDMKNKSALVFSGAGDDLRSAREDITSLSGDLLTRIEELNTVSTSSAGVLADDLAAVNSKLSEVYDAVMDIADDLNGKTADIDNYTEDISTEDTVGRSDGKTASCVNTGEINGDISVGGIAGTMAKENALDPEGDLETSGTRSLDFVYKTKTVVRDSVNHGAVRGKRDYIGGITGDMSAGAVISCLDTGNISSEDGGYVGGIAGRSSMGIYSCSAVCSLSGNDYVGGITGMGKDIYECRSFVEPVGYNEFCGSVAGFADGELKNNRFVENGFGGSDGVSLEGKAYPITFEQMISEPDIPDEFKTLKMTFAVCTDDGSITDTAAILRIPYGGSITDDMIPAVPEKTGYFGKWADFEHDNILFGSIIKAEYSKLLTSVGSDERDENGLVRVIAEGSFTDDDKVTISGSNGSYHITLPRDTDTTVRYLPDGDPKKTELYSGSDRLDTEIDGRYLVFTAHSSQTDITERQKPSVLPYYAAGGGVILLLVTAAAIIRKKCRKKFH